MSLQIDIKAVLDDEELKSQIAENQAEVDKTAEGIEANKEAAKESFNQALGIMRASYQMISGITTVMGGDMSKIFSSIYAIAVGLIGTYTSITAAIAATGPAGWVQAGIMTMSLISAGTTLLSVMTGQTELTTRISGITTALHGLSGMISSFSL